jgi:hypothetical protein
MKSGEAGFRFPVLGFTHDQENWGFPDLDRLTRCGPCTLRKKMQDGMELIDASGRRWQVRAIRRTGRAGSILSLLPGFGPPQSRIEQELEELPGVSLAEVQQKARKSVETFRSDYTGFDDDEAVFSALLERIGQTRSIAELYEALQPDTFEAY